MVSAVRKSGMGLTMEQQDIESVENKHERIVLMKRDRELLVQTRHR